jgi:hypothetical protein
MRREATRLHTAYILIEETEVREAYSLQSDIFGTDTSMTLLLNLVTMKNRFSSFWIQTENNCKNCENVLCIS